jgi:hypothetical protein
MIDTDLEELGHNLCRKLQPDQLRLVLEAVTASYEDGFCPICEAGSYPVDTDGVRLFAPYDSGCVREWREEHYPDCLVSVIERHLYLESQKRHITTQVMTDTLTYEPEGD